MDREIEGRPSADYLWNVKNVVPFLKVDKGLADEADGAQVMKPMPGLDELLDRAVAKGVFGTKMRSVIKLPTAPGVDAVVDQQFEVGRQILGDGPGADHRARGRHPQPARRPRPRTCSRRRSSSSSNAARRRPGGHAQADAARHRQLLRASSSSTRRCCGWSRCPAATAATRRARSSPRNNGVIASFSRALTEGLTAQQSDDEFNATLDAAIAEIAKASSYLSPAVTAWCARSARRSWTGVRRWRAPSRAAGPAMVLSPTLPTTSRSALTSSARSTSASTGAPTTAFSSTLVAPAACGAVPGLAQDRVDRRVACHLVALVLEHVGGPLIFALGEVRRRHDHLRARPSGDLAGLVHRTQRRIRPVRADHDGPDSRSSIPSQCRLQRHPRH